MDNLHKGDELLGVGHDKAAAYAADIGVLGVLRALMRLRGLVLLPFLARTLGPAAFGVWTQSLVAIDIGSSIIGLQLHQAVVRFVAGAEDREQQREIFFPVLFITIALGFLVSCLTLLLPKPISSVILGDISYVDIARWLGLWIAANAISRVGLQLLRGLHRVKLYGFLSTSITLVQLVTVVVVLLYSNELSMAIFTAIVVEIIGALLILTICFAEVGVGLSRWKRLRAILKFSLPLVPGYIADLLLSFSDRLIIAAMLGSEAIGIYAAAYTLARLMREIFV
ncbi:MAG: oligosaccharide flippase family protein, partial [Anaerolineales bacterium]